MALVSFVQHSCGTRVVRVALVSHLCCSRVARVASVAFVSLVLHSCRSCLGLLLKIRLDLQ